MKKARIPARVRGARGNLSGNSGGLEHPREVLLRVAGRPDVELLDQHAQNFGRQELWQRRPQVDALQAQVQHGQQLSLIHI